MNISNHNVYLTVIKLIIEIKILSHLLCASNCSLFMLSIIKIK